jgi:ubiquinone/menaquinone biosynthesis C-methylase UbiE
MGTPLEARGRAAATFNAASDRYDHPANSYWDRFGRGTVERLGLEPEARVLDVCCGSGASALPAAEQVGPKGSVLGIDLAVDLLGLAFHKARARGLDNVVWRVGDLLDLDLPDEHYDAVVCGFGVFFIPDMAAAVRELWRMVRPGGKLALTTWGPRLFEPANAAFWGTIRDARPDLYKFVNPWDRICHPPGLHALMEQAGVPNVLIDVECGRHAVESPEAWWTIVLGSHYRGVIEQLAPDQRERVRQANLAAVRDKGIRWLECNVVYAVAAKGAAPEPENAAD